MSQTQSQNNENNNTNTFIVPAVVYGFEFDNKLKNVNAHATGNIHLCKSVDGLPVYASILVLTDDINDIYNNIHYHEKNSEHLFQIVERMIALPSREYYIKNNSMIRTECKWRIVYWNQNNVYNDLVNTDYESD